MIFKKKDQLIGIDIGSSSVKVAQMKSSAKGYTLNKLGMAELPEGLVEEGRIMDADALAEIIRNLFRTQKIKHKNVAISTGGYSVVIKTIVVPKASEKDLVGSIRVQAEQYIPYDIEDVNIDFQIMGTSEFSDDQMNVLLVAVKKDLVAEYIDLINEAGLNPCVIDVDSFALQNIYEAVYRPVAEELVLLLDVGMSKTSLNILKGTQSLMMRDTASGTGQIRDDIMSELGCSAVRAEKILKGTRNGEISETRFKDICSTSVQTWCSEIQAVVKSYLAKSGEGDLEQILVSGGGIFVDGLIDSLAFDLSTTASVLDPFQGITINPKQFPISLLEAFRPQVAIAMGLSLRRLDDK